MELYLANILKDFLVFVKRTLQWSFIFLWPLSFALAQPVVINEIAWMGSPLEKIDQKSWWQYEWLELYNGTSQNVNISGWQIENAGRSQQSLQLLEAEIPALGYFLICKKSFLGCDIQDPAFSLKDNYQENNELILKDNRGIIIDQTPKASKPAWPAGEKETKKTMERKIDQADGATEQSWQTSAFIGGTPKKPNSFPTSALSLPSALQQESHPDFIKGICSSGVFLNEILPSPHGPDETEEWIELFNRNKFSVSLANWQIKDLAGKIRTYVFPQEAQITGQGFLLLSRPETKITLNNNGDGLLLICPNQEVVDEVRYEKAALGKSYSLFFSSASSSEWFWSEKPTPKAQNEKTEEKTPPREISSPKSELGLSQNSSPRPTAANIQSFPTFSPVWRIFPLAFFFSIFSATGVLIIKNRIKKKTEIPF